MMVADDNDDQHRYADHHDADDDDDDDGGGDAAADDDDAAAADDAANDETLFKGTMKLHPGSTVNFEYGIDCSASNVIHWHLLGHWGQCPCPACNGTEHENQGCEVNSGTAWTWTGQDHDNVNDNGSDKGNDKGKGKDRT